MENAIETLASINPAAVVAALENGPRLEVLDALELRDDLCGNHVAHLTRLAATTLQASGAGTFLWGRDRPCLKLEVEDPDHYVERLAPYVVAADQPVALADVRLEPGLGLGARAASFMGVPLHFGGPYPLGVLGVVDWSVRRWVPDDVAALTALSVEIANALLLDGTDDSVRRRLLETKRRLENALEAERTLLKNEREVMRRLTRVFLGRAPQVPGYEFADYYQTADEADRIGGDFYDFIRVDDRRLAMVIGDVCGKGLAAAVHTAHTVCFLRFLEAKDEGGPGRALRAVNRGLIRHINGESVFVTLFLGWIDLKTGRLTYANAGHPAPLVLHQDGRLEPLTQTGPALSILENAEWKERQVEIPPGGSLVMFTDGITEASGTLQTMEDGGLGPVLGNIDSATASADTLLYAVVRHARQEAKGRLKDDAAVVVVRRSGRRA
ncbi:MAG TPA: SpoIIE family protein phosphatase [Candidatus Xenobia bacterium]|jgi:serine phosphatase RsbU (regulator of sigma subunit)